MDFVGLKNNLDTCKTQKVSIETRISGINEEEDEIKKKLKDWGIDEATNIKAELGSLNTLLEKAFKSGQVILDAVFSKE